MFKKVKKRIQKNIMKSSSRSTRGDDSMNQIKKLQTIARAYTIQENVVKIHIGSGPRILKGWLNIDLAFEPFEEYLRYYTDKHYPEKIRGDETDFFAIDVTKQGIPLPDNSVDIVFHEDFFEHITQRDQVALLAECYRILKKGCVHRINTPDLIWSMNKFSNFKKGFKGVYFGEWDEHGHKSVVTQNQLREYARLTGYSKVVFNAKNGSSSKLTPIEYRPDPNDRSVKGNVYADLIK